MLKRAYLFGGVFGFLFQVQAEQVIDVQVGNRIEPIKNIIDFFHYTDNMGDNDYKALKPRYLSMFGNSSSRTRDIRNAGLIPVNSLHGADNRSDAKNIVNNVKNAGGQHINLWSEPNRTFKKGGGSADGNWLKDGTTWNDFIKHAHQLYLGVKDANANAIVHGPQTSTDPATNHAPDWFKQLVDFLTYWVENDLEVDYLQFNPPYDPGQVYQVSSLAKGFSANNPKLKLKGVSIGEYPFYVDHPATHVRYFIAFEKAWNMLFACKAHYRATSTNSGLLNSSGKKLAVYHAFREYANLKGIRVESSMGNGSNALTEALGGYDSGNRTLTLLVANDMVTAENFQLKLLSVKGGAQVQVFSIHENGLSQTKNFEASSDGGHTMQLDIGEIREKQAAKVVVKFTDEQTLSAVAIHSPYQAMERSGFAVGDVTRFLLDNSAHDLRGRLLTR